MYRKEVQLIGMKKSGRTSSWLRAIKMGLWGVSKVCLVLLFLTLNLLLLFQDFSFLLQERHVNENAVGEDLIVRYEIERKLRKTVKVEMANELISTFFSGCQKIFTSTGHLHKMHREWEGSKSHRVFQATKLWIKPITELSSLKRVFWNEKWFLIFFLWCNFSFWQITLEFLSDVVVVDDSMFH